MVTSDSLRAATLMAISLVSGTGCLEPTKEPREEPREGEVGRARLAGLDGVHTVTYVVENGEPVVGGDIVLPQEVLSQALYAAPYVGANWWPNGIVPYVVDSDIPDAEERLILEAAEHYQRETAIRLVPYTNQFNHVEFAPWDGAHCRSARGMQNSGLFPPHMQLIRVSEANGCGRRGHIHELGHTLGLLHEHQRDDRAPHIDIHEGNMNGGEGGNFDSEDFDGAYAGPYDTSSIMHYHSCAWSKEPGLCHQTGAFATITLDTPVPDGNGGTTNLIWPPNNVLSDEDMRTLERMYPTKAAPQARMCRVAPRTVNLFPAPTVDVAEVWQNIDPPGPLGPRVSIDVHRVELLKAPPWHRYLPPARWVARTDNGGDGWGWVPEARWSAGDFDGDGIQDLAAAWNDQGQTTLTVWKARTSTTPGGFSPEDWAGGIRPWSDSTEWLPGDFDNDGDADLMEIFESGTRTIFQLWRAEDDPMQPGVRRFVAGWSTADGLWTGGATAWNVADFNADGFDDILAVWSNPPGGNLTVRLTHPTGLIQEQWLEHTTWAADMRWLVGNFDGQGGPDVIRVWKNAALGVTTANYLGNLGGAFSEPVEWLSQDGGWSPGARWLAGDHDGNGLDDLLAVWNDGGRSTFTVRLATGVMDSQAETELLPGVHWGVRRAGWQDAASWCPLTLSHGR